MTALELRAGIEELLNRAELAERALVVAQKGLEEANALVRHHATEAAVLKVRLENARDIERRDVVMYLRAELGLVHAHGLLLSPERLSQLLDDIDAEKHVRPVHV